MSETDDLVDFIQSSLNCALSGAGIDPDTTRSIAQHVEQDVRRQYGGDRHYVRKTSPEQIKARNRDIIRAWQAKESRSKIAADFCIGRTTVDRIIDSYLNKKSKQRTGFGREDWVL